MKTLGCIGLIVCTAFSTSCQSQKQPMTLASPPAGDPQQPKQGYGILYQLLSKEKDADKLLLIKFETDALEAFVVGATNMSKHAARELERLAKADPRIDLEHTGLPVIELATRKSIESFTAKQLLTSSGEEFEVLFLLSQLKAMQYAHHLALMILEQENDVGLRNLLEWIAAESEILEKQGHAVLMSKVRTEKEQSAKDAAKAKLR